MRLFHFIESTLLNHLFQKKLEFSGLMLKYNRILYKKFKVVHSMIVLDT